MNTNRALCTGHSSMAQPALNRLIHFATLLTGKFLIGLRNYDNFRTRCSAEQYKMLNVLQTSETYVQSDHAYSSAR